jgi:hypothetical protein
MTEIENLTKPYIFKQQLKDLTNKLHGILEEFDKAFLFYNKNPQNNEYLHIYETSKNNLNTFNADVFMLSNDIESNTSKINNELLILNKLIIAEKQTNKKLKHKLHIIENKELATDELIDDYTTIYKLNYNKNWGLFISILISCFAISKIYSNKI